MLNVIKSWFDLGLAGHVANMIAIVGFAVSVFAWASNETEVQSWTVSVICLVLLWLQIRNSRRERYVTILKPLENLAEESREIAFKARTEDINLAMEGVLQTVSNLLGKVVGTNCRVAIKLVDGLSTDRPFVFVFARDRASAGTSRTSDSKRQEAQYDTLERNKPIRDLIPSDQGEDYFFVDDIPRALASGEYESSSVSWQMDHPDLFPQGQRLGYKSAGMALIRSCDGTPLGFLGVDSPNASAFRHAIDGPLLVALAQLLSPALETIYQRTSP